MANAVGTLIYIFDEDTFNTSTNNKCVTRLEVRYTGLLLFFVSEDILQISLYFWIGLPLFLSSTVRIGNFFLVSPISWEQIGGVDYVMYVACRINAGVPVPLPLRNFPESLSVWKVSRTDTHWIVD